MRHPVIKGILVGAALAFLAPLGCIAVFFYFRGTDLSSESDAVNIEVEVDPALSAQGGAPPGRSPATDASFPYEVRSRETLARKAGFMWTSWNGARIGMRSNSG
jgi:hypothetical protein